MAERGWWVALGFAISVASSEVYAASTAVDPTFDQWLAQVRERGIAQLEDSLSFLPESFRSRYALMFQSRSLHEASFQNPRVLMFGETANLILTFNGAPNQRGYRAMETLEFQPSTSRFIFREVLFPPGGHGTIQVSAPNPEKCLKCHTSAARPIWDSHPAWPGAYGEMYLSALSSIERAELNRFVPSAAAHPRYRHLAGLEAFAEDRNFKPTSADQYSNVERLGPNAELTALLARKNFKSILGELKALPGFKAVRYALLGALDRECGDLRGFFPASAQEAVVGWHDSLVSVAQERNAEQVEFKRLRLSSSEARRTVRLHALTEEDANRFRTVAEAVLGAATDLWTMEMEKGTFDFDASGPAFKELELDLIAELGSDASKVRTLAEMRSVMSHDKYCQWIRTASVRELEGQAIRQRLKAGGGEVRRAGVPALLPKCISCHQNGPGPYIPYADTRALMGELVQRRAPHGKLLDEILFRLSPEAGPMRMPLGINATEADRAELKKYFLELAAEGARFPAPVTNKE